MRNKEKSCSIYFVRHGQTDYPLDRIYCDSEEDPPLNANGLYQAKSAAIHLKDKNLTALYASPALRTQMTAREVSQVTDLPVKTLDSWGERRFGVWEGLYFHEIEAQYPDAYTAWKKDKVGFTPENGETIEDVRSRLVQSLGELLEQHSGENIAVVTHVGPIRIIHCHALSIPMENYRQIRVDYASISRIDFGETLNNLIMLNYFDY